MDKDKKKKKPKKVESEEEEDDECDLDFDKLSKKDMIKIKKLFGRLQEQELQLEQQEEYLIGKIEELKALNEEHEKLKHLHNFLIGKHEKLEKEYACATNVSSCVDPLEKENAKLKAQLEVLSSKHVKMQKDYELLTCSHEDLHDAHAMLQVSHEVVVTSVKHFNLRQEYTCSPNFVNSFYANACCSQSQQSNVEQINIDSCDDLIDEENDLLKLQVQRHESEMVKLKGKTLGKPTKDNHNHMVNKLELEITVNRSSSQQKYKSPHHKKQEKVEKDLNHIRCFKCSDMGHYAFMCSTQVESKMSLTRRQRRQLRTIICFGCKKEGHKI
jgi:hypothetical protein